jgi:hypothetical protein
MEEERLQVTEEQIRDYLGNLSGLISGASCHFVDNMDERGHQEWADRGPTKYYVSATHPRQAVYFPVSRKGKRITLIACIAADGTFLKPSVIISRKTYDEDDLGLLGWTQDNCFIDSQRKSFVDMDIFAD